MPRRVVPIWSLPELRLARVVEGHVVRHDQVRVGADRRPDRSTPSRAVSSSSPVEHLRVDHDAVADRAQLARVQDPGRDQVELPVLAVAHDGVPGVVAALEVDHEIRLLREEVDDLALAFVAPLGVDDHDSGHVARKVYGGVGGGASEIRMSSGGGLVGGWGGGVGVSGFLPVTRAFVLRAGVVERVVRVWRRSGDRTVVLVLQALVVAEHGVRIAALSQIRETVRSPIRRRRSAAGEVYSSAPGRDDVPPDEVRGAASASARPHSGCRRSCGAARGPRAVDCSEPRSSMRSRSAEKSRSMSWVSAGGAVRAEVLRSIESNRGSEETATVWSASIAVLEISIASVVSPVPTPPLNDSAATGRELLRDSRRSSRRTSRTTGRVARARSRAAGSWSTRPLGSAFGIRPRPRRPACGPAERPARSMGNARRRPLVVEEARAVAASVGQSISTDRPRRRS